MSPVGDPVGERTGCVISVGEVRMTEFQRGFEAGNLLCEYGAELTGQAIFGWSFLGWGIGVAMAGLFIWWADQ